MSLQLIQKISRTQLTKHVIETGYARPVKAKNFRVSPQIEKEIESLIKE